MKNIFLFIGLIMTSHSFAAQCMLTAQVSEGESCSKISTRLDVNDLDACKGFASTSKDNKFFGLVEENQRLVVTEYAFTDRSLNSVTENKVVHDEEVFCD